jgi:pyridoxine 4-dehydrogenase
MKDFSGQEKPAMATVSAAPSGEFMIGGDLRVTRLGFGAMRITGKGIWDQPADPAEAKRTLAALPDLGIDLIDTADSYGPFVSEDLIAEVLSPYKGITIATKGGLTRHGPDIWKPVGRPEYLRQCVMMSLRRLKLERIDLWQLHRIDPKVPAEEQFGEIAAMRKEGLIRHVGLSEVSVAEIEAAQKHFPVTTVQNRYNLVDRKSEEVLDYCEKHGIGFIPWAPLSGGSLARKGSALTEIASKLGTGPSQVALAWVLKRSPVMIPIPGTGSADHLRENVAGASITLSDREDRRDIVAWMAVFGGEEGVVIIEFAHRRAVRPGGPFSMNTHIGAKPEHRGAPWPGMRQRLIARRRHRVAIDRRDRHRGVVDDPVDDHFGNIGFDLDGVGGDLRDLPGKLVLPLEPIRLGMNPNLMGDHDHSPRR